MIWQTATLGELCDSFGGFVQTGPFGSQLKQSEYVEDPNGIPVVMPKDIRGGRIDLEGTARITEQKSQTLSRHLLTDGDIIFPRRGDINKLAIVEDAVSVFCGTGCLRIHTPSEGIVPKYLFYFLGQPRVAEWLEARAIGTTMLNLNTSIMRAVEIRFPGYGAQQRIASILSAYDDLIENNRRRIALLEEAARQLYKEWFVRFRFPGHEHVKIIDSVPEGWDRSPFSEVVDFKEGPGLRNYQYRDQGIPFINIRTLVDGDIDLRKTQFLDPNEVEQKYRHFLVEENDHVVSSSGTLGRVATVRKCHLPLCLNTSIIRMRPRGRLGVWLLRAYLSHGDFLDQATARATGAAQLNFGPSHLKQMDLLMPTDRLLMLSEEVLTPIYEQMKVLNDQNLGLTKARDLLLPKLMSGAIAV